MPSQHLMDSYGMIATICAILSISGSLFILSCYLFLPRLRLGVFQQIITGMTLSSILLTTGIEFSGAISNQTSYCQAFAFIRIYGQLCMISWSLIMMWCIRKLVNIPEANGTLKELEEVYAELEKQKYYILLVGFGGPLPLMILPLASQDISDQSNLRFCYIYEEPSQPQGERILKDIEAFCIWLLPMITYFVYSGFVLFHLRKGFQQQLDFHVNQLFIKIMMFPLIAFICSLGFTIEEINEFFVDDPKNKFIEIDVLFLELWGLFNAFAYFYLHFRNLKYYCCPCLVDADHQREEEIEIDRMASVQSSQSVLFYESHQFSQQELLISLVDKQQNTINC